MATLHAIGHVAVMTTAVSRRPPLLPWEAPLAPRSSLGRQNDRILGKMASIWTRLNAAGISRIRRRRRNNKPGR